MYTVAGAGGRQCKVWYSDIIYIEKLAAEQNATAEFKVVTLGGEEDLKVGAPFIEGINVTNRVLKNDKQRKITIFTHKPKKSSKRKMGHCRSYTEIQIETINA